MGDVVDVGVVVSVVLARSADTWRRFFMRVCQRVGIFYQTSFAVFIAVCDVGHRVLDGMARAAGLCVVLCGRWIAVLGVLIIGTGGKFWFYTMQMASTHGVTLFGWRRFAEIVLWAVPTFLVLLPIFFCLMGKTWRERAGWFVLVGGFVFLSGLSRAYAGAFFNVLMPMYVCLAVVAAAVVGLLLRAVFKTARS